MLQTKNWSTTVLLPTGAVAASASADAQVHDALFPGTRLDEFEILRVLGAGGFGIVYLALDHVLLRQVAIKEYMPVSLAGRGKGAMVSARSVTLAEVFATGLESFCEEARLLASFDHPSLVKVHRFWKANGTAYMVMPYYAGQTLKDARRDMIEPPDEIWLRALVEPLLGALELLHREGVYHRDIAPDNILLLPDGRPVLLDFGSARRVIGDRTQTLTAILKPNFAPVEQYADEAGMRQGPWTDLYSLGATVHFALTGQAPTPAVLRAVRDALPALSSLESEAFPGVKNNFLATIDWTLALAPDDRPQSVASVRQAFSGDIVPPGPLRRYPGVPGLAAPRQYGNLKTRAAVDLDPSLPATAAVWPGEARASRQWQTRRRYQVILVALAVGALGAVGWSATRRNGSPAAPPAAAFATTTAPLPLAAAATEAARVVDYSPLTLSTPAPAAPAAVLPARLASASVAGVGKISTRGREVEPHHARAAQALPAGTRPTLDAAALGPRDACGDRSYFSLALCVNQQCELARWRSHPKCVEARRTEDQRQHRMEQ